jgi:hypothetical protein
MRHFTGPDLDDAFAAQRGGKAKDHFDAAARVPPEQRRAIRRRWIDNPDPIDGASLRLLRFDLDLTTAALGPQIGALPQAIDYWETMQVDQIPSTADQDLRVLYRRFVRLGFLQ